MPCHGQKLTTAQRWQNLELKVRSEHRALPSLLQLLLAASASNLLALPRSAAILVITSLTDLVGHLKRF